MPSLSYKFPGVYVVEDASPGLIVSSSPTAIPVFAHDKSLINQDEMIRIDSWLDFRGLLPENGDPANNKLYLSLEAYFQCGGGRAYLCPTGKLEELVPIYDDITLLVAAGENINSAAATLCVEGKFLFAVLDCISVLTGAPATDMSTFAASNYAAVYGPWLKKPNVAQLVPPSAAAAGLYASTDRSRGVWKAPANVALLGGLVPNQRFSESVHGDYNDFAKPLNLFRAFTEGPLLWGARTLSSDPAHWRYVSVRRLFNSVEQNISRSLKNMLFEPNNQPTWVKVQVAIYNYLFGLWEQGALLGDTADNAFFVQIGKGQTMNDDDIKAGRLIAEVGLKAVSPAEFIVLRFTQDLKES